MHQHPREGMQFTRWDCTTKFTIPGLSHQLASPLNWCRKMKSLLYFFMRLFSAILLRWPLLCACEQYSMKINLSCWNAPGALESQSRGSESTFLLSEEMGCRVSCLFLCAYTVAPYENTEIWNNPTTPTKIDFTTYRTKHKHEKLLHLPPSRADTVLSQDKPAATWRSNLNFACW